MTTDLSDLDRLQRETIRKLAVETARLQDQSAQQVILKAITFALVCVLLGVAIAVGLTLLGRVL